MPSKEEIEDHEVAGHLPFRSWRTHCVRGKGHEQAHFRQPGREDGLPEAHLDYAFIGSRSEKNEDDDSKLMPVLVVKETFQDGDGKRNPEEGIFRILSIQSAVGCLEEIGLDKADLVIKSDQEAAAGALVDDSNGCEATPELSSSTRLSERQRAADLLSAPS